MKKISAILFILPIAAVFATVLVNYTGYRNGGWIDQFKWFQASILLTTVSMTLIGVIRRPKLILTNTDYLLIFLWLSGLFLTYYRFHSLTRNISSLLLLGIWYTFLRTVFSEFAAYRNIPILFLICLGAVFSVWGMLQLYGFMRSNHEIFKTTGPFHNPGPYGGYLAIVCPISIFYISIPRSKSTDFTWLSFNLEKMRFALCSITLFLVLLILPSTMSRAAWISAFVGCCITLVSIYRSQIFANFRRYRILFFTSLIFLSISSIFLYKMKRNSADGRILIWTISTQIMKDHPEGTGLGSFAGKYGPAQAVYFSSGKGTVQERLIAESPEYAFNDYLQIAIELGIVPCLFFLFLIGITVYKGCRHLSNAGIVGSFFSILIFCSMSYPMQLVPFAIVFLFFVAFLNTCYHPPLKERQFSYPFFIVQLTLCWSLLVISLFWANSVFHAYERSREAMGLYASGLYKQASNQFQDIISDVGFDELILFTYAKSLRQEGQYSKSTLQLKKALKTSCDPMLINLIGNNFEQIGELDSAAYYYQQSANTVPNRIYPHYLIAKLNVKRRNFKLAKEKAEYILGTEPKLTSFATETMKEEMKTLLDSLEKIRSF